MFSARTDWSLAVNELTRRALARQRAGVPVIDLTESNPTRCGFEYDSDRILAAFRNPRLLSYEPDPRGPLWARQAVREYYQEQGIDLDASQIFLTASTSEAYSFLFRLAGDPGGQLLVPRPSYPLFDFLTRLNDMEAANYSLIEQDGWCIDHRALEQCTSSRSKAVLVVNPNNPTGSFVHGGDRAWLLDFCWKHQLPLIADEVFYDYAHGAGLGDAHKSFAAEKATLVFILNGLSKISALPQMKCAWIVLNGPEPLVREAAARLEVIADTYLSLSTPVAAALPELLLVRRELQPQIMARIGVNLACLDRGIGLDSSVSRLPIEGGWYAVLRFPAWHSDDEWALRLLEQEGVLVHPGHFYDFESDGRVVISLICRPEDFAEGVERLVKLVAESSCR